MDVEHHPEHASSHIDATALGVQPIACWCLACGGYLFQAPNSWRRSSKNSLYHALKAYRSGNVMENMRITSDEFDGAGQMKGCSLRYLRCNNRNPDTGDKCDKKIALHCHRATREKRYKDTMFIMINRMELRRGKKSSPEQYNVLGDDLDRAESVPDSNRPSRQSSRRRVSDQRQAPESPLPVDERYESADDGEVNDGDSIDVQVQATQDLTAHSQTIPIRQSPAKPKMGVAASALLSQPKASAASTATLLPSSNQPLQSIHDDSVLYNDDDSDDDDGDLSGYIMPYNNQPSASAHAGELGGIATTVNADKLAAKVESQQETIEKQQVAINNLVARVESLKQELVNVQTDLSKQMAELMARVNVNIENVSHKRKIAQMLDELMEVETPPAEPKAHSSLARSVGDNMPAPARKSGVTGPTTGGPALDEDDPQGTLDYLKRTVRQDDSSDEDYNPVGGRALSYIDTQSSHTLNGGASMNSLQTQHRSPHHHPSKRGRGRPRTRPLTTMRPLSFSTDIEDSIAVSNSPTSASGSAPSSSSGPNGHSGSIVRRGISGRTKAVPPHLSHQKFAASNSHGSGSSSTTPTSFERDAKRQRMDLSLGTGSFKPSPSSAAATASSGGKPVMRDAEGYLLKANGQRDLRSIRGRTLGHLAFQPTHGQRVTVASLGVARQLTGSPSAGGTYAATPPGSESRPQASPHASKSAGGVTPSEGATSLQTPDLQRHVLEQCQERVASALTKGPATGKEYSDRHADIMNKLSVKH